MLGGVSVRVYVCNNKVQRIWVNLPLIMEINHVHVWCCWVFRAFRLARLFTANHAWWWWRIYMLLLCKLLVVKINNIEIW